MKDVLYCLRHAIQWTSRATKQIEKLPHSEKRITMYGLICNIGKLLDLVMTLAKQ